MPVGLLIRWGGRLVVKPLRSHLVPRWMALLLLLVQADVIVDWARLASELRAAPGWAAGVALALAVFVHGAGERRIVGSQLLGPRLGILRRQPAADLAFGVASAAFLGILVLPIGVLALIWYGPRQPFAAWLWLILAFLPLLLHGAGRPAGAALAAAGAGLVAVVGQRWPGMFPVLALLATGVVLPLVGRATVRLGHEGSGRALSPPGRPAHGVLVFVRRDLLALMRLERGHLVAAFGVAGLLGAIIYAVRVNNDLGGLGLARAALIGLAIVGTLALSGAGAAARRAAGRFDPPEWPVSVWVRAAALALTGGVLVAPSWAAAAVGGAGGLGVWEHLRLASLVVAVAAGVAWLVAARPKRPDHALFPWWIAACLGFAWVEPAWGPLGAAGLGGFAVHRAGLALARRRSRR